MCVFCVCEALALVQVASCPARVCHSDIVLVFELSFGEGQPRQRRHVALLAAAGRQANVDPQQCLAALDVMAEPGDDQPFHSGLRLGHRRRAFERPVSPPHAPLHLATVGRICFMTEDAFVAELVGGEEAVESIVIQRLTCWK